MRNLELINILIEIFVVSIQSRLSVGGTFNENGDGLFCSVLKKKHFYVIWHPFSAAAVWLFKLKRPFWSRRHCERSHCSVAWHSVSEPRQGHERSRELWLRCSLESRSLLIFPRVTRYQRSLCDWKWDSAQEHECFVQRGVWVMFSSGGSSRQDGGCCLFILLLFLDELHWFHKFYWIFHTWDGVT